MMDNWKRDWKILQAELRELEEHRRNLLRPTQVAYERLLQRIEELEDGRVVGQCEGCAAVICNYEPVCSTNDAGDLCLDCAPDYDDMLQSPKSFTNEDGEPMTVGEAFRCVEQHVSRGGVVSDKIVFPPMVNGKIIKVESDD